MSNILYGIQPKLRREGLTSGGDTSELETVVNATLDFPGDKTIAGNPPTAAEMNAGTAGSWTVTRVFGGLSPSWLSKTATMKYVITQGTGVAGGATVTVDGVEIDETGVEVTIGPSFTVAITPTGDDWAANDEVAIQWDDGGDGDWPEVITIPVQE